MASAIKSKKTPAEMKAELENMVKNNPKVFVNNLGYHTAILLDEEITDQSAKNLAKQTVIKMEKYVNLLPKTAEVNEYFQEFYEEALAKAKEAPASAPKLSSASTASAAPSASAATAAPTTASASATAEAAKKDAPASTVNEAPAPKAAAASVSNDQPQTTAVSRAYLSDRMIDPLCLVFSATAAGYYGPSILLDGAIGLLTPTGMGCLLGIALLSATGGYVTECVKKACQKFRSSAAPAVQSE